MPIVSSTITEDRVQHDGRRAVRERHVDHVGVEQFVSYLAESTDDIDAIMAERVPTIEAGLASGEIASMESRIGEQGSGGNLVYGTPAQLLAAVRERFRNATGMQACRIAKWLLGRSDAALRAAFGMTQVQVTALRVRLQSKADAGDSASNQGGE